MTDSENTADCLHCRIRAMVHERFSRIDPADKEACAAAFNETICQVAQAAAALLSDVPAETRDEWLLRFTGAFENAWEMYLAETLHIQAVTAPKRFH